MLLFAVVYRMIISRLKLSANELIKIGLVFIVGGAGMFTLFPAFRCITFLTVPTLTTHPGRVFLNAMMAQSILEGMLRIVLINSMLIYY